MKPKNRDASTTESPVPTPALPPLVPQPHGGSIYAGGIPGNGGGRPPSALREQLRGSFAQRVAIIEGIADGEAMQTVEVPGKERVVMKISASPADRLRALDLLAKYGLGAAHALTVEEVRDRLRLTLAAIQERLPPNAAASLIGALREVWTR